MKSNKIFAFVFSICFLLSASCANSQEIKSLYLIQNVPQENMVNIVGNYLAQSNFKIINKDDFYIVPSASGPEGADFYEILLRQDRTDCYMYYLANSNNNSLEPALIKEIKKGHYKVKKVESPEITSIFEEKSHALKQKIKNRVSSAQSYDFSDQAQSSFDEENNIEVVQVPIRQNKGENAKTICPVSYNQPTVLKRAPINPQTQEKIGKNSSSSVLKGAVVTIAGGTVFNATLQSAISSASLFQSDRITAVLDSDFKYKGYLILPSGTILYGTAAKASAATAGYGNGSLDLLFDQALTPNGRKINIAVDKISYAKKSERALNITKDVVVGAGIGVLSGLLSAAYTGNYQQALLVGASMGAAGGGIYAATRKGEEIEIPEGTKLDLKISQPINISPYN